MIPEIFAALLKDLIPTEGNFRVTFNQARAESENRKCVNFTILKIEENGAENLIAEISISTPKK